METSKFLELLDKKQKKNATQYSEYSHFIRLCDYHPAPGTRQFSQALLAVGPPVGRTRAEKIPASPRFEPALAFAFFITAFKVFSAKKLSKFLFQQRAPRPPKFFRAGRRPRESLRSRSQPAISTKPLGRP